MDNLIVMKLGGSVLTKKENDEPEINFDNLRRLAKEIAEAKAEKGRCRIHDSPAGAQNEDLRWLADHQLPQL